MPNLTPLSELPESLQIQFKIENKFENQVEFVASCSVCLVDTRLWLYSWMRVFFEMSRPVFEGFSSCGSEAEL